MQSHNVLRSSVDRVSETSYADVGMLAATEGYVARTRGYSTSIVSRFQRSLNLTGSITFKLAGISPSSRWSIRLRCRARAHSGSIIEDGISQSTEGFDTRKSFRRSRTGLAARFGLDPAECDGRDSLVLSDNSVMPISEAL